MRPNRRKLFKMLTFIALIIVVFLFLSSDRFNIQYFSTHIHKNTSIIANISANESLYESYITHTFYGTNTHGRLGNWLYELISLYGIARKLKRKAFIDGAQKPKVITRLQQLAQRFPLIKNEFKIMSKNAKQVSNNSLQIKKNKLFCRLHLLQNVAFTKMSAIY
jgi:hypothetical protein